jgi:phenylacetic acid degradation operon negative regulatory protein
MVKPRNDERPLSARSIVASTLLGMRPPRLPTRILVGSGQLFGVAEGTTRVAISRMVAAGELTADADGYALAGPLLVRQARQQVSRLGTTRAWRGAWRTEIVVGDARPAADRTALRVAASALRLAELRPGVWMRPDNLSDQGQPDAEAVVAEQCESFTSRPRADPATLARALWDVSGWATRSRDLRQDLDQVVVRLDAGRLEALAPAFVLSASVLRHLQADPLLPAELLPHDWPGAVLRADYDRYDQAFRTVWRTWYHAQS